MFSVCSHLGGVVPRPGPDGGGGRGTPARSSSGTLPPPSDLAGGDTPPWVPPSDLAGGDPGGGTPPWVPPIGPGRKGGGGVPHYG